MTARSCLLFASLSGMVAVALGAFGSHALKVSLPANLLQVWHTAVAYQFTHTLALLAVALLLLQSPDSKSLKLAAAAFSLGILLFSGSLYILALSQQSRFGMITPIGGLSFLLGWACLFISAWRWQKPVT